MSDYPERERYDVFNNCVEIEKCPECGALIADLMLHAKWHGKQEGDTTVTEQRIRIGWR